MIKVECFNEKYIRELQMTSKRDPLLLERTIYAFGLLEALAKVGLPFIFKGGTCLMLLLDSPKRLSTDIDVVVAPDTDLDEYLDRAAEIFPFQKVDEQKRVGKNNIVKRHFKFTYNSPINQRPFYILLDVLFEENHYSKTVRKEIKNDLLLTEPAYLTVEIPSADCILADKLTAFAPHTTGIPLGADKDMEVMKQLYDVISLIDIFTSCSEVLPTYKAISKAEIEYRDIDVTFEDCLWDTFDAAFCIASRGKVNTSEYPLYIKGIRDLRGHIYAENYSPEIAAVRAVKVMYFVMCLLNGAEYQRVGNVDDYKDKKITNTKLVPLSYLRKVNLEAYSYLILLDEIVMQSLD